MISFWQFGLTLAALVWACAYVGIRVYKGLTVGGSGCGGCGGCSSKSPAPNLIQLSRKLDS